ncbi:FRG domain-containing protein [Pseudomonas lutea]|uniref:FRG domain-containing protein n=1 Tax=Pseudomonas lutea TaxID=243924 RepID=UPI0009DE4657|nr:FRG domain-containing protein [Pseudomonas lutea]
MLNYTSYVYRGHADSSWKLEPTLDRIIKTPTSSKRASHLERFKFETRGRRGSSPVKMEDDNDWWALGQHHGLATPLLDWTESPFVALFFAASAASELSSGGYSVYAIHQTSIKKINERVNNEVGSPLVNGRRQTVKVVRPLSDENKRLVSQRGLFTRGPNNVNLEDWVRKNTDKTSKELCIIKVTIPNLDSKECLRYLNRMNISHSTLFPDLPGASDFCNMHLSIDKY